MANPSKRRHIDSQEETWFLEFGGHRRGKGKGAVKRGTAGAVFAAEVEVGRENKLCGCGLST